MSARKPTAIAAHLPRWQSGLLVLAAVFGLLIAGCGSGNQASSATATPTHGASSPTVTSASPSQPAATATPQADLKLLKVTPDKGPIGTPFTITGDGLPAGRDVAVSWSTVDGSYDMTATPENVQFNKRVFTPKRVSLGTGKVGADGKVSINVTAPEDFGEVHDLFLQADGKDIAKAGFRIMRQVKISPESGPIGTPITISVTGLGWTVYTNTIAVRYDNSPSGIITATTTHGTTTGTIRAAGAAGKHVIDVEHGSRSVPYLNNQQSGTADIPDWRFWFTITDDHTMPPNKLDWPDAAAVVTSAAAPKTTADTSAKTTTAKLSAQPASSPINTQVTVIGQGFTPNTAVDLFWVTAHGNRVSPSGWSLNDEPLGKATTGADGSLSATVKVPNDLGGWHVIKVASASTVQAQLPFFVERSLVEITQKVKAGEEFTIHLKGVGWTELDNGVAINYDNAYLGFACGFNSQGDVTVKLVATGQPGIHLIDLYPMIYQGHGEPPWGYQASLLSYKTDAPGLGIGYRLPAFRLAIEVE